MSGTHNIVLTIMLLKFPSFDSLIRLSHLLEINYLGQLSHPNLVKLIGYCLEDKQ
ncbi:hypothetical protein Bca4012_064108 [Brassica carinata]